MRGRAVEIEADSGAELVRELARRDDGAMRLGEVALVDGGGRIGALDTIFRHTLLDENAASHIAIGRGFPFQAEEPSCAERINASVRTAPVATCPLSVCLCATTGARAWTAY